jgi:hypothetical protein
MSEIQRLLTTSQTPTLEVMLETARKIAAQPLPAGSCEAQAFCALLSARLLGDARTLAFPALQALGFWLRPAAVTAMMRDYLGSPTTTLRVPAGIVLQIPPANVDSLFGYTLALSLLCGNVTIIRLSDKTRLAQELLLTLLGEILPQVAPQIAERILLLRYGHDDAVTAALSSICDARLVWGGDATIAHMRGLSLPPLAREASFGDRFSMAVVDAAHYLGLDNTGRDGLVQKFFNDIYWFDQLACSSPRLLVWVGACDAATEAQQDFYPRLTGYAAQRGYTPRAAESLAKLNMSYLALHDLSPKSYRVYGPQLNVVTVADLRQFKDFRAVNYGYGLLVTTVLPRLADLAEAVERRDQTLTVAGFKAEEISTFAVLCQGRGFERIVPTGQALAFDAIWDGQNLFDVMTRLVKVVV